MELLSATGDFWTASVSSSKFDRENARGGDMKLLLLGLPTSRALGMFLGDRTDRGVEEGERFSGDSDLARS